MEQIVQLKSMRDEAKTRLQANPDYKLTKSLDALIEDLESFVARSLDGSEVDASEDDDVAGDDDDPASGEFASDDNAVGRVETSFEDSNSALEAELSKLSSGGNDEEAEIADAVVDKISEDITSNGVAFGSSTELDMEAEAAIEALEAELSSSGAGSDPLKSGSN